jgi:acetyl esterase/lipase
LSELRRWAIRDELGVASTPIDAQAAGDIGQRPTKNQTREDRGNHHAIALLIVDEADVLRDEGEAYASRLRAAGVAITTVRYDGITHDFMMLNPLSETRATRAAVAQAIATLRHALHAA